MSINQITGHENVYQRLSQARRNERLTHGLIFSGAEGIGKKSVALHWAQLLLCHTPVSRQDSENGPEVPCGDCGDCKLFRAGNHPDLHMITKQLTKFTKSGRDRQALSLSIDIIREFVIRPAGNTPARNRAAIFIIDDAHEMQLPAQNALLKTLEEPPEQTYLILVTARHDALLPTIRSRCRVDSIFPAAHRTSQDAADQRRNTRNGSRLLGRFFRRLPRPRFGAEPTATLPPQMRNRRTPDCFKTR